MLRQRVVQLLHVYNSYSEFSLKRGRWFCPSSPSRRLGFSSPCREPLLLSSSRHIREVSKAMQSLQGKFMDQVKSVIGLVKRGHCFTSSTANPASLGCVNQAGMCYNLSIPAMLAINGVM